MRRAILLTVATLVFGPIAFYLGKVVWFQAYGRLGHEFPSATLCVIAKESPGRFADRFDSFAQANGFAMLAADRIYNSPDKHYVAKNGLAMDIMTFEPGHFTINLWDRKTTGAWEELRKGIVGLVESEFSGAEVGEELKGGICVGFRH